ncbi:MAG: hypothetical protein HW421_2451 [Ignavibacteria bacterium]|nr:hypothetical protein [Ignavibacteria bacterium]
MTKIVKPTHTKIVTAKRKTKASSKSVVWKFPLKKKNLMIAALGLGVILLGYILMATGITEEPAVLDGKWNNFFAINVAPILLTLGYCAIIPFAIYKFFPDKEEEE